MAPGSACDDAPPPEAPSSEEPPPEAPSSGEPPPEDEDIDLDLSARRAIVPSELARANAGLTAQLLELCEQTASRGVRTGRPGVMYCDLRQKCLGSSQSMRYVFTDDHATRSEISMPLKLAERLMPDAEKVFPTQLYYAVRATDNRFDVYLGQST